MSLKYNASGITNSFKSLPDGFYILRVTEAILGTTTTKGDPKVTVNYVVELGPEAGRSVRYHTVVFFADKESPGASMSLHYLKCINEPCEGDFEVNPEKWVGKLIRAKVINQTRNGKTYPSVKFVTPVNTPTNPTGDLEEVPF